MLSWTLLLALVVPHAAEPKCIVRRGQIDQVDAVSQMIRVRFAGGEPRYFYIHTYVRIALDGKPGDFRLLHERMAADIHTTEPDGIVVRVTVYQRTPPPLVSVALGPFDDTAKILRHYPKPGAAIAFKKDEELRMAVPGQPLVVLSESEADADRDAGRFAATIADPKLDLTVKRSPPIVPLGTRAKVVRVAKNAYEIQVQSGSYKGRTLFVKKDWVYPVDENQAAKKAEEGANP